MPPLRLLQVLLSAETSSMSSRSTFAKTVVHALASRKSSPHHSIVSCAEEVFVTRSPLVPEILLEITRSPSPAVSIVASVPNASVSPLRYTVSPFATLETIFVTLSSPS